MAVDVLPNDAHNTELVANVHPPDWRQPNRPPRYNLVVIGGGTAGLVTAAGAAGLGAREALIERHLLGGDCLNGTTLRFKKAVIATGACAHHPMVPRLAEAGFLTNRTRLTPKVKRLFAAWLRWPR